jgi:hypothetical protein
MMPRKDSELMAWSANFATKIAAAPEDYGLTAAQASEYGTLNTAYAAAYAALTTARAQGTRSESMTAARDATKAAVLNFGRQLYAIVSANGAVSNTARAELGIHLRSGGPSPATAPAAAPVVGIVSVAARRVNVVIHDGVGAARPRKLAGAIHAFVYTFVGPDYPANAAMWQFHGIATRAAAQIHFPDTIPSGAQVWIRAAWVNRRGQIGPASSPVTTNLQGGGTNVTKTMHIAA